MESINLPDELALKAEIQEISDRIDQIIEAVNQYQQSLTGDADLNDAPAPDLP